eukprot:3991337-Amphidinium_carterae.1
MGAEGQFDVNTNVPPFPARGYEGPLDDLLLLGSTLANGGISPKTGKRVITAESVSSMLEPRMVSEAQRESFFASHQAQTMARFVQRDAAEEALHAIQRTTQHLPVSSPCYYSPPSANPSANN